MSSYFYCYHVGLGEKTRPNHTLEYHQAKKKKKAVMTTWNQYHQYPSTPICCAIFISINQWITFWNFSIQIEWYWPPLKVFWYLTIPYTNMLTHILPVSYAPVSLCTADEELWSETSCFSGNFLCYMEMLSTIITEVHWSINKVMFQYVMFQVLLSFFSHLSYVEILSLFHCHSS